MKKRYIFLLVSLVSVISVTYLMKKDYNNIFIEETKEEISVMHNERDSVFSFAEEVLSDVSERKKNDSVKIDKLDDLVKNKQITIEQQVTELNKLVTKSNELKELAEKEKEKALEMEKLSNLQKIEAEKNKLESLKLLEELNKKYNLLVEENNGLKDIINSLKEENFRLNNLNDSLSLMKNKRISKKNRY